MNMPKQPDAKADCYSTRERAIMVLGQRLRAVLLGPLLRVLVACRISPDQLTLLALLVGLLFCPLYFWSKPAAFVALGLHVFLDGLDGPLARRTGVASRQGSFVDTMSDQLVIAASTISLMVAGTVGVAAGGCYIFFYTVVVLFAMARNVLSIPYSWLLRPRFLVYAWFLVETYLLPGTIDYVLWLFNAVLALKMTTGFIQIRRRM
jgi:phosphatidylglycerophosphate synthase